MPPASAAELWRAIPPRSTVAIVGRSRSGRSTLLQSLAVQANSEVLDTPRAWGKFQPQDLGRRGASGATRLAEALDVTGLWPDRMHPISALGYPGAILAELVVSAVDEVPELFVDDLFDAIDPWRRKHVVEHLKRCATVVLTTHDLEFASACDLVAVMDDRRLLFWGPPQELIAQEPVQRFEVETSRGRAVAALVAPFAVDVTQEGDRLTFRARQGQEATVQLLLAGYGDVRSFVTKTPTLTEAIASRIGIP